MSRRTIPAAALAAALALAIAGCGGGTDPLPEADPGHTQPVADDPSPDPDPDDSTVGNAGDQTNGDDDNGGNGEATGGDSSQAAGNAEVSGTAPLPNPDSRIPAGSRELIANPSGDHSRVITNIRTASHDGFDRIVIDLADDPNPGWFAQFVDEALWEPSGLPIFEHSRVYDKQFLDLRLTGMIWPGDSAVPAPSFEGPALPGGPTGLIHGIALGGWFEGQIQLVIVLDTPTQPEVTITALGGPPRVVVDIIH